MVLAFVFAPLVFLGLLALAYASVVEPAWLRVRVREIPVARALGCPDGVRILHISDLHVGVMDRRLARLLERVATISADVVVITGDFVDRPEAALRLAGALGPYIERVASPVVAVLGNHDRFRYPHRRLGRSNDRFDAQAIEEALARLGITLLGDRSLSVSTAHGAIRFAGLDILSHSAKGIEGLLSKDRPGSTILLAHSPDIYELASDWGVPLVLAGHTHGGQVRIGPWWTPTTSTQRPLRPPAGLFKNKGTWMHVSPGLGTTLFPLRFFARPEATVLELRRT